MFKCVYSFSVRRTNKPSEDLIRFVLQSKGVWSATRHFSTKLTLHGTCPSMTLQLRLVSASHSQHTCRQTHSQTHKAPLPHTLNTFSVRLGGFCRPFLHFSQLPDNENIERQFLWRDQGFCLTEKHMHSTCSNYGFIRSLSNTPIMRLPLCPL